MKKKILVVDNHPLMSEFMTGLLEREGHEVIAAEDGVSALNILTSFTPDIMFIDLIMPRISGEKLCQIVRSMQHLNDCYLVIVSAAIAEQELDYSKIGASAYITKGSYSTMGEHILAIVKESDTFRSGIKEKPIMCFDEVQARQMTKELLSQNRHLEIILESMSEGILEVYSGRIVYANSAAVSMLGLDQEKFLGSYPPDLFDKFVGRRVEALLKSGTDKPSEIGPDMPVEINGRLVTMKKLPLKEEPSTNIILIIDVSERKRVEEVLRKQAYDLGKRVKELNCLYAIANLVEKPNISLEDILQGIIDLIPTSWQHPEITCTRAILKDQTFATNNFKETVWKQASDIIVHGERIGALEVFYLEERPEIDEGPFLKEERALINAIAERLARIIERKRTEEALRESEERLKILFEYAPDGYYLNDLKGNFIDGNKAAEEIIGYKREELIGKSFLKLKILPLKQILKAAALLAKNIQGKHTGPDEFILSRKDGTQVPVEIRAFPVRIKDQTLVLCIARDISERRQAEEEKRKLEAQLGQAQRAEALGTLAGGIAHNFNNLLMGIYGNASLMLLEIDSARPNYERLKNIEKSVQNGSRLTRQLLGYAREGRYEVRPISLNQMVKETSDTFGTTKKEIRVHLELAEDLWGIKADQGQIEQVLLNLYVNAADAMPAGGDLFLKTMNVTHKDMKNKPYKVKSGNYVLLTVADTGVGMDKKTMERVFDPFFTTKGLAKGTGLGLASVYGIVKAHGGYIDVESKKGHARPTRLSPPASPERERWRAGARDGGQGTTFEIYLPASERKVEEAVKRAGQIVEGGESILLVDDEEMVLDVGVQLLKALGYTVLEAKGGREAVEIYRENKDKIDMVLLDMIMPDMGGGKAYDRMKEINPNVKVLLSSGYSIDGQATEILERGCNGFIQKPFDMKELSKGIRAIFDKE